MNILVVGLGNPSKKGTPHNIGSDLLRMAFDFEKKLQIDFPFDGKGSKIKSVYFLTEPDYMNVSGPTIVKFIKKHHIKYLIVVVDDIDTPVGKLVTSYGTSHRGHNGIKSIISSYGKNFWKIRIGVGREGNPSDFVLNPIKDLEPFIKCVSFLRDKIFSLIAEINSNL